MSTGYTGEMPPRHFNMAAYCVGRPARTSPNAPALLVVADPAHAEPLETWTFAAVERAVLAIAAGLKSQGLAPGARIMIRLPNTSAYALLFFGAIAGGFVPLPVSTLLTAPEVEFLLADSGAEAVAFDGATAPGPLPAGVRLITPDAISGWIASGQGAAYARTAADDPAFLIYTSGTTSKPKGVLHAQRAAWGRRPMYRDWYDLHPGDRVLHAGAFNWTYTLGTGLTDPWANGATCIVYTGEKDPALWPRLIAQTGATLFAGVPSLYRQILKYAEPTRGTLGALRHGLVASESPPAGLLEEWRQRTGTPLYEALGMSELSTFVSSSPSVPPRPGFVGKPQTGRSVCILPAEGGSAPLPPGAEGLLAVHRSDPGMMLGYWQRPKEEAEVMRGDWFIPGDLAVMDGDGYIGHRGRANDIMKAQGYRVSPLEVEAVLAQHPDVQEVAVAEIQVRADVSVIGAFIVAREGRQPTLDSIQTFASAHLAAYKCPRAITLLTALPRTANGKLQRGLLQAPAKP